MGNKKCIICGNTKYSQFKFPKQEYVKQAWIKSLNLKSEAVTNNSKVCARHFKEGDFSQPADAKVKIRRIKKNAVPVPSFESINYFSFERNTIQTNPKCNILQCFMCGSSAERAFLRFPVESKLRMKWLENLNIMNASPSTTIDMFLCDIHFKNEDVTHNLMTGKREIKPESVPVKIQHNLLVNDEEDCMIIEPNNPIIYISDDDEENEKGKITARNECIYVTKEKSENEQKLKSKVKDLEDLLDNLIEKDVVTRAGSRMINEVKQKYEMPM